MLSLHVFALSIDTQTIGAPLEFPEVISTPDDTSELTVSLELSVYQYNGPAVVQNTRGYNGGLVGPTIRIKPGDDLNIVLTNSMAAQGFDTAQLHNQFRQFDVTNLHTHGLHISGEAPGDDIFTEVAPGATNTYQYSLPASHMGGTFWYHPHHHGSTAVHAGGGAVGMLIVDDPAGSIPDDIAAMPELLLVMVHLNMPELTTIAQEFEANCQDLGGTPAQCDDPVWANGATSGQQSDVVLLNGMTEPVLSLVADTWYRFRMVFAAVDATLTPTLDGCTVRLLAKDGIYLPSAPRDLTEGGFMGPGNRADWAVSCPAGTYSFESGALNGREPAGGHDADARLGGRDRRGCNGLRALDLRGGAAVLPGRPAIGERRRGDRLAHRPGAFDQRHPLHLPDDLHCDTLGGHGGRTEAGRHQRTPVPPARQPVPAAVRSPRWHARRILRGWRLA